MRRLPHGGAEVALHDLKDGAGPALLCLHELEGDAGQWHDVVEAWPGPVVALDFSGHGDSTWLAGGGYTPEYFAADADVALASLSGSEPVGVVGAGIGAYVALLLAGARPDAIGVAGLLPGRGLEGGGASPADARPEAEGGADLLDLADRCGSTDLATDPLVELCHTDLRPPDYAGYFAASASALVLGEDGGDRPPWWREVSERVRASPGPSDPAAMIAALAAAQ